MTKLDFLDEELSAPEPDLEHISETVKKSDIDTLIASDIPLESKKSQLLGLVKLMEDTDRDKVLSQAKAALNEVEAEISDPIVPQITS